MMLSAVTTSLLASLISTTLAVPTSNYIDWKTFKATGVNLGGWLVQEAVIDPVFWAQYAGNATDEWGLCAHLATQCGPVLEKRYATFINPSDIDLLASSGVTILRIPTSYAAWVKVPAGTKSPISKPSQLMRLQSTTCI
ncbi:glucan 13-beta-glucosidase precursor protein [Rutstroemia sp. NJR-2017a BBW]|nr:glucan 13-beta-glucosidase precursor protein [Rutstroemia sp. NJR-2017a BBW]